MKKKISESKLKKKQLGKINVMKRKNSESKLKKKKNSWERLI